MYTKRCPNLGASTYIMVFVMLVLVMVMVFVTMFTRTIFRLLDILSVMLLKGREKETPIGESSSVQI